MNLIGSGDHVRRESSILTTALLHWIRSGAPRVQGLFRYLYISEIARAQIGGAAEAYFMDMLT